MPGQNAFAFDGTAFVPEDRNLTAGITAWTSPSTRSGIARAYGLAPNTPASQFWIGFPPQPQITVQNSRTGTFPNLVNSILITWTVTESTLISGFTIFAQRGTASFAPVATVDATTREYRYGSIDPNIQYNFYVRANSVTSLVNNSSSSGITLSSPPQVSVLGSSKTTSTATVSWTVPAGQFQRFDIYDATTYLGTVNATLTGQNYLFTRTGLSQGTNYTFRVYGFNYDNYIGSFREAVVTTNTLPIPSLSWESTSETLYNSFRGKWTAVGGITYQPQISSDNSTWTSLGSSQTGTTTLYTAYTSPGYASTRYIRLSVTDGEVTGNSNVISVTPGRPQTTTSRWSARRGPFFLTYNVTTNLTFDNSTSIVEDTQAILWGNPWVWQLTSNTAIDHEVTLFRIRGYRRDTSKNMTADQRRLFVMRGTEGGRRTDFDNLTNGIWVDFGTYGYQNATERVNRDTRYWGYCDPVTYYDRPTRIWRYAASNTSTQSAWHIAPVDWQAEFQWYSKDWETVEVDSQIDTTYG